MIIKDLDIDLPKINEKFNDPKDKRNKIKNFFLEIKESFEEILKEPQKKYDNYKKNTIVILKHLFFKINNFYSHKENQFIFLKA